MVSHTLILNAVNYGVLRVVDAVYGDTARQLLIIPRDINIEGATAARVNFTRANGTNYYADGVINGNTITVPMQQMLTCVGQTHCNLDVTLADGTIQSFEFVVSVHAANGGAPVTPEEAITLAELQGEVEDLSEDLNDNYYDKEEVDALIGEAGTLKPGYAPESTRTEESEAGAKGWYFGSWVEIGANAYDVTLLNADGSVPDYNLFTENDILSAKAGFSANYALLVEVVAQSTTECLLTVHYTDNFSMLSQGAPFDPASHLYGSEQPGYVWNPSKPGIGSVEIGIGAMAIGYENRANELGSLSIGANNEVDGRYALATGQGNKVAYGSTALGHNNSVYGYDAFASGSYITLRNWRTTGFGQTNSMNAVNGFVSGHGNNATASAHDGISIRGTYAVNQQTDTFIDVVGGGSDADHRANASALTPAGNYRIRGDIFVKCNPDSSGGTNLRTALEGKEDKGTYTLLDEWTVSADTTEDFWHYLDRPCRCVLVWLSFPRTYAENFRVYANEAYNQNGGQVSVTVGANVCNAKFKFDCTHGVLEAEWAKQEGLGGYVTKTTYAGYANEPVIMSGITKIILRNISNDVIRAGTKIKIYAY